MHGVRPKPGMVERVRVLQRSPTISWAGPPRVIVVDDDPIIRSLIATRISKVGGRTVEAEDGMQAWDLLAIEPFDLALVDLEMPNLDGLELIRCIRGHPRTRHMPVVVVTSRSDGDAVQDALAVGATAFLTKPLQWGTFSDYIASLLRMSRSASAADRMTVERDAQMVAKDAAASLVLRYAATALSEIAARLDAGGKSPDGALQTVDQTAAIARSRLAAVARAAQMLAAWPQVSLTKPVVRGDQIGAGITTALAGDAEPLTVHVAGERLDRIELACDADVLHLALRRLVGVAHASTTDHESVRVHVARGELETLQIAIDFKCGVDEARRLAGKLECVTGAASADQLPPGCCTVAVPLAIASTVIAAHAGTLAVHRGEGGWTRFAVVLPASEVSARGRHVA